MDITGKTDRYNLNGISMNILVYRLAHSMGIICYNHGTMGIHGYTTIDWIFHGPKETSNFTVEQFIRNRNLPSPLMTSRLVMKNHTPYQPISIHILVLLPVHSPTDVTANLSLNWDNLR